jgi:hypothetical protein
MLNHKVVNIQYWQTSITHTSKKSIPMQNNTYRFLLLPIDRIAFAFAFDCASVPSLRAAAVSKVMRTRLVSDAMLAGEYLGAAAAAVADGEEGDEEEEEEDEDDNEDDEDEDDAYDNDDEEESVDVDCNADDADDADEYAGSCGGGGGSTMPALTTDGV